MKKQLKKKVTLKKLTIARINNAGLRQIKGGDCLPTEHADSDVRCDHSHIP
ncbi:class I lanthipeptide [Aquimarina sp. MMG015]|uniref:class I lanthipeptide n=1 Tax=Aquimarina sp. MMG015 TaxID=2822689 RepID=UPI001B3A0511|nr:class I lanthipeptide [Aquimarina sp. MMG015]MBQ4801215.1 class I lanthipeptide [Aquimarina sp. MMG015]